VRFRASELPGTLVGPDVAVGGVAIDSRRVQGGELFVPVVAARDGHEFIPAALAAGASAYLTSRAPLPGTSTAVVVDDASEALAAIGRLARDRLPERIVGITGSSGKTSTKDLLGAVLSTYGPTGVSERSHNNELGVPLTLANAPDEAWAAVVEMGARGAGHIRWLCSIARPTVGVVTNVSHSHTEFLGSIEGVAMAKAELVEAMPAWGTAVLNADDERVAAMAVRTTARVLTFGVGRRSGEVRATRVVTDEALRPSFTLESPWGRADVRLEMRGAHQAANAVAAAAAALVLGVGIDTVAEGLAAATASPWRMDVTRNRRGVVVVNDAYNANPASVEAALRALAAVPATGRRIAVLGPMLELGAVSGAEHRRVAALAGTLGVEFVAVGTDEYGVPRETEADVERMLDELGEGDAVLVKGSRAAGLERLASSLAAAGAGTKTATRTATRTATEW
jgi:UDP-N-acetylmuramoyl-tripeptide--D-alanyl-D-alanine ligase